MRGIFEFVQNVPHVRQRAQSIEPRFRCRIVVRDRFRIGSDPGCRIGDEGSGSEGTEVAGRSELIEHAGRGREAVDHDSMLMNSTAAFDARPG